MRTLVAVSFLTIVAACASTDTTEPVAITDVSEATDPVVPNNFDLAMQTVADLVAAGNEQLAIDRLTQLLGDPKLTESEKAAGVFERAELRYGDGNNVWGAIEDYEEVISAFPSSDQAALAIPRLDTARGEATSLNGLIEMGEITPTEEFEYRFRLGEHQDAADLMLDRNLKPENEYLLDMFQVGYLCDDPNLTGPSYDLVEPDGTERLVRFCEFGK